MTPEELEAHRKRVDRHEEQILALAEQSNGTLSQNTKITLRMAWGTLAGTVAILLAIGGVWYENKSEHNILEDQIDDTSRDLHDEILEVKVEMQTQAMRADFQMGDRLTGSMFIEIQDLLAKKNPDAEWLDAQEVRDVQSHSLPYGKNK